MHCSDGNNNCLATLYTCIVQMETTIVLLEQYITLSIVITVERVSILSDECKKAKVTIGSTWLYEQVTPE